MYPVSQPRTHRCIGRHEYFEGEDAMSDMENQPPGWYRDRVQPNRHRYWDGLHWIGPVGETLDVWARIISERAARTPAAC
jgi:hypothetical protein